MVVADVSILEQSAIAHFVYAYVKVMGLNVSTLQDHAFVVVRSFGTGNDGKRDAASITVWLMRVVYPSVFGCIFVYQRLSHDDLGYLHTPTRCLLLKFLFF